MPMSLGRLARPFELKQITETGTFSGYGSVFGVEDSYQDIVMPGAFAKSLRSRKPAMLWQHNSDQPIGVYETAREDQKGLYLEGKLVLEVQAAKEAHALMKAGAMDGLSIGFRTIAYEYDEKTNIRKLTEIELWEVSPVTFPALDVARINDVKAMTHSDVAGLAAGMGKLHGTCKTCVESGNQSEMMSGLDSLISLVGGADGQASAGFHITERTLEAALRDAGLTRVEAKKVLAKAKGLEALRDAAPSQRDAAEPLGELLSMVRGGLARIGG
jgi:HK97 family phage prohead protease